MRRAAAVFGALVAASAFAGCRGLLGIESLQVAAEDAGGEDARTNEDGSLPSKDGSSPGNDSGADAKGGGPPPPLLLPDGAPPADAGCQSSSNPPCQPCCRTAFAAGYVQMEEAAIDAGCLCHANGEDAGCSSACAAFCANPQAGGMQPSGCNMCLDFMLAETCQPTTAPCDTVDCINARACLASCAPP